jgi:hypothetical protein
MPLRKAVAAQEGSYVRVATVGSPLFQEATG